LIIRRLRGCQLVKRCEPQAVVANHFVVVPNCFAVDATNFVGEARLRWEEQKSENGCWRRERLVVDG
jgi:hypothetical protein